MSLTKLPCILAATVGLHHSCNPPNIAPKREQVSEKITINRSFHFAMYAIKPFDMVIWAVGLAEAAAIVAHHFPSWSLSERTISTVLVQRNPQDLRLTPLSVAGLLLIVSGSLLRVYCYRALSRFFTFEVSIRKGHRLITTGPYSVVRHPSYTAIVAVYLGTLFWYGARGSWVRESGLLKAAVGRWVLGSLGAIFTMVVVALLGRMPFEEATLKKTFGREWNEWAQRVPCLLVPGVY